MRMCHFRRTTLLMILVSSLMGLSCSKAAAAQDDTVEAFKNYLSHRPPVESVLFLKSLNPQVYVMPKRSIPPPTNVMFHGRWKDGHMYYLQQMISSLTNVDQMGGTSIYAGRSNSFIWQIAGGKLVTEFVGSTEVLPQINLSANVTDPKPILNDALNLGMPRMIPSSVVWTGNDFEADIEGGKIKGRLNIEDKSPISVDYHGKGTYLNPEQRFRIEYSFAPGGNLPSRAKSYRINGTNKTWLTETVFLGLQPASADLQLSLFDPNRFFIRRWDTVLVATNNMLYYRPQGTSNELAMVDFTNVPLGFDKERIWFFATMVILISLPIAWLIGRRISTKQAKNTKSKG